LSEQHSVHINRRRSLKKSKSLYRISQVWAIPPKSLEVTELRFHNTGASTQCQFRVLTGSRYQSNRIILPNNRITPQSILPPANSRGTSGKAATSRFHFKSFLFPVNLGPTRTYDSAMGGNASTGLGSADCHNLQDMRCSEADDRPNEETNRKSLFPADKTLHNTLKIITRPNSLRLMRLLTPTWAIWCSGKTAKIRVE